MLKTKLNVEIDVGEAKMKLTQILLQVQSGMRFTITNRGKPIADLIPRRDDHPKDAADAIDRFLAFKKRNRVRGKAKIKALREEGRH